MTTAEASSSGKMSQLVAKLPSFLTSPQPDLYYKRDYVVLDFETTNLDHGSPYNEDNKLVLACWTVVKDGKITHKEQFGTEFDMSELVADCECAEFIVAHNAKFELGWLHRCGYDVGSRPVWCTQVVEHVISGNRQWRTSLDECCIRRGWTKKDDLVSRLIKGGVCCSQIPRKWLLRYCHIDVDLCHHLFLHQLEYVFKHGLQNVTYCRLLTTPVLADIERYGMQMDAERVNFLYERTSEKLRELDNRFAELTGGINPNSGPQMAEYLYETLKFPIPKDYRGEPMMTATGRPKTNSDAINALKPKSKKQLQFLELYKEIAKTSDLLSKYLRKMHDCCEEKGGLLRASLNQTRTQTHRLSSTGQNYKIQFQNVQRELKGVFKARHEGWLIGEVDYSQLEYRTAVDMAGDKAGLEDILNGVDAHGFTASIMFDDWADESLEKRERKALRTAAKPDTFKPLYGGSSGTPRQQKYYRAFKDKHREITGWQQDNLQTVLSTKRLRIPSGLTFYWPDTKITQSGYIVNTAPICNYPVQSFATADIVPLGLVWFWHLLRAAKAKTFIVNTVHDSIITETHPDELELYKQLASYAMIDGVLKSLVDLYNYRFTTPLDVEFEVYTHWVDSGDWYENFK